MKTAMKEYVKPIIKMHEVKLGDYLKKFKTNENKSIEYGLIYNSINNFSAVEDSLLPALK